MALSDPSWGRILVFRAAGVNGADPFIHHPESAEVLVIAVAKRVLVFKVVAHAALPSYGHFAPGISNGRFFLFGQPDLQLNGFPRKLCQRVSRERTASADIALRI